MADIVKAGSTYDLMSFEDILKDRYPNQLLAAYRKKLEDDLEHASCRDSYERSVSILGRFGNIEGGAEARSAACTWIRSTYPRRPALQDELNKRERTWLR